MRLNKFFIAIGLAVSTLCLQSCLKDQEDFFNESSSERLQGVLENAKTVLTSSENGWIFDYYPDRDLSYGGYIYTVKFDDKKVSVRSEIAPDMEETSLYKLNTNNGPVLSFDSYNTLMHFFATPSNGNYEAMDGDFEFMIMSVTEDLITLRGLRTGNTMYLRRLDEDPAAYIKKIEKICDYNILSSLTGTTGTTEVRCGNDSGIRYMEFSWGGDDAANTVGEYYLTTPTGIRFMNPVSINGSTISELTYTFNPATNQGQFSGQDSAGNQVTLSGSLPATYSFISEFNGSFTFSYAGGAKNVRCTLVADKANSIVYIKGLNVNYDLIASYNKSIGCIELCGQVVASDADSQIIFVGGTSSGFYTSNAVGFYFIKDPDNPANYLITPNKSPNSGKCNNSFVIIHSADKYYLPPVNYRINGDYNISNIIAFIKN